MQADSYCFCAYTTQSLYYMEREYSLHSFPKHKLIITANTGILTWISFIFSISIKNKQNKTQTQSPNSVSWHSLPLKITLNFQYVWKFLIAPMLFTLAAGLLQPRKCKTAPRLSASFSCCQSWSEELKSPTFAITPQMLHLLLQPFKELGR